MDPSDVVGGAGWMIVSLRFGETIGSMGSGDKILASTVTWVIGDAGLIRGSCFETGIVLTSTSVISISVVESNSGVGVDNWSKVSVSLSVVSGIEIGVIVFRSMGIP